MASTTPEPSQPPAPRRRYERPAIVSSEQFERTSMACSKGTGSLSCGCVQNPITGQITCPPGQGKS